MSDDSESYKRRCGLIDQIETSAIEGAKGAPRLRSAWALERLEAVIEEAHSGRLVLSPEAQAIARRISEIVDRVAHQRGWSQLK
jgi:hypothetical protein